MGNMCTFTFDYYMWLLFKREEIFAIYDGIEQRIRYSPYEINPYIGLSIHLFVFSFILTNEGVGGGLNFSFKM